MYKKRETPYGCNLFFSAWTPLPVPTQPSLSDVIGHRPANHPALLPLCGLILSRSLPDLETSAERTTLATRDSRMNL